MKQTHRIFGSVPKSKGNKSEYKQVGLHQIKKLLCRKESQLQNFRKGNLLSERRYLQIIYQIRS